MSGAYIVYKQQQDMYIYVGGFAHNRAKDLFLPDVAVDRDISDDSRLQKEAFGHWRAPTSEKGFAISLSCCQEVFDLVELQNQVD